MTHITQIELITSKILIIRGEKVMLDADLAKLYGVTTKRLNEQLRRNRMRFPDDFVFQLTKEEKNELVANCDHLKNIKYSKTLPWAFTEHGAIMVASVLNTPLAIEMSVFIVRAFIQMRDMLRHHKKLAEKLAILERKVSTHDVHIRSLFEAIRQLMSPPPKKKSLIGFTAKD